MNCFNLIHLIVGVLGIIFCEIILNSKELFLDDQRVIAGLIMSINIVIGCYLYIWSSRVKYLQFVGSILILASTLMAARKIFLVEMIDQIDLLPLFFGISIHVIAVLFIKYVGRIKSLFKTRELGIVKWFNKSKGFGFIARNKGGDVFVHYKSILDQKYRYLEEGQEVKFYVINQPQGLQAEGIIVSRDK